MTEYKRPRYVTGESTLTDRFRWQDSASCASVGLDVFYPESGNRGVWDAARSICSRCPVKAECLEFALKAEVDWPDRYGMFGGLTPEEREVIGTRRALAKGNRPGASNATRQRIIRAAAAGLGLTKREYAARFGQRLTVAEAVLTMLDSGRSPESILEATDVA